MKRWIAALAGTALWLALAAAAFAWPEAWQPDGQPSIVETQGIFTAYSTGEEFLYEARVYADSTVVISLDGRPILVDLAPDDPCALLLMDLAIYNSLEDMKPQANWPATEDWRELSKQDPTCKVA